MRHARNFNPEWGYLAPAPGFLRTARMVVVAAAVGASAGAAVVFSLVDHPIAEESVAARTLVLSADASSPRVSPQAAELKLQNQPPSQPMDRQAAALSLANAHAAGPAASESGTSSTTQRPPGIAALAEAPAVVNAPPPAADETAATPATPPVVTATAQKKPVKRTRFTWQSTPRMEQAPNREPLALLRPFGAYPRSDY